MGEIRVSSMILESVSRTFKNPKRDVCDSWEALVPLVNHLVVYDV